MSLGHALSMNLWEFGHPDFYWGWDCVRSETASKSRMIKDKIGMVYTVQLLPRADHCLLPQLFEMLQFARLSRLAIFGNEGCDGRCSLSQVPGSTPDLFEARHRAKYSQCSDDGLRATQHRSRLCLYMLNAWGERTLSW
jgi:hypothetical protein